MAGGKAYVLTSGLSLTNSFVYTAKYNTLGFGSVAVIVENVSVGDIGSGVQYTVRGYPVVGMPLKRSVASGSVLTSGSDVYLLLSDTYAEIDVGLKATQDNMSGIGTVYVTGKRR